MKTYIKQRMVTERYTVHEASDGRIFTSAEECIYYEKHNCHMPKTVRNFERATKRLPHIKGTREEIENLYDRLVKSKSATKVVVDGLNRVVGLDFHKKTHAPWAYYFDEYDFKKPPRFYDIGSWDIEYREHMINSILDVLDGLRAG